jgi:hypothetical protein
MQRREGVVGFLAGLTMQSSTATPNAPCRLRIMFCDVVLVKPHSIKAETPVVMLLTLVK